MDRNLSYPTQSRSVPAVSGHSPPTFSWDMAPSQRQQPWDPSQMLYGADQYSDGEDVAHQDRTIPPLTWASDTGPQFLTYPVVGHPMNSSEDDQYQPSRLTRISDLSYPTQSRSVPAVLDNSPTTFSCDVAPLQLLQPWDPSQMLYSADQYSNGEDASPQDRTIPPLTRASDIGHQFLTYPVFGYGHPTSSSEDDQYQPSRLTRISDLSHPTQSDSVPAVLDHSPPTFSCDVAPWQLQQPWDPSQMLYAADQFSDSEDVSPQERTIPPLTQASDIGHQFLTYPVVGYSHPTNLSEDDQYQPSRLTRISALAPPPETYGTQDYAPRAPPVTSKAESLVASMPPNARPLPPSQAHTLNQIYPVENSQYLRVDNADASYSPHPIENNGGSPKVGLTQ
ncbi:hypothetical protein EDD15DRAFT_343609 [Pisolithus albus]|nr:hypothetical protein EDD15DRAFT_343609 [Pisolithus albus]